MTHYPPPNGQVKRWTWITDLPFTARTVEQVMRAYVDNRVSSTQ